MPHLLIPAALGDGIAIQDFWGNIHSDPCSGRREGLLAVCLGHRKAYTDISLTFPSLSWSSLTYSLPLSPINNICSIRSGSIQRKGLKVVGADQLSNER